MINFKDEKVVKDFVFDLMVENRELKVQNLKIEANCDFWYKSWQKLDAEEKKRQEEAELPKVVEEDA